MQENLIHLEQIHGLNTTVPKQGEYEETRREAGQIKRIQLSILRDKMQNGARNGVNNNKQAGL